MPWTRPNLTTLVTRIEADITSRLTGGAPLLRHSLLAILARVWAGAIHTLHGFLSFIALQLFIRTAEGEYLDAHAAQWGVTRLAATFGTGNLTVTGVVGTSIPAGTVFVRGDGLEYISTTLSAVGGGGSVSLAVSALSSGELGNAATAIPVTIQTPISGIDDEAAVAAPGITGGTDQETDAALRVRIFARIQNPPAGGSESDYKAWAKSITGVENAWVFPAYSGLGTVGVVITATGSNPVPSGPLVTSVQNYIDSVRPVTAIVTVYPIVSQAVALTISIKQNTQALRDAILAALTEMFENDGKPGGTLLISHINEAIATSGVEDHVVTDISVAGSPVSVANIPFTGFNYPVLSTPITFNTLA